VSKHVTIVKVQAVKKGQQPRSVPNAADVV